MRQPMKPGVKRGLKIFIRVAAVYGLLAAILPRVPVGALREPIRKALQDALGRHVEVGDVRLGVWPQPGFTVENVTIGEDPAVGAEPAVYVNTMRAVPGLRTFLGGPLSFASVNLTDASVNLTRGDRAGADVRWNFASLLRPELLATFPSVHLRGGRVNFKFDDTKSIFYLLDTDVDLWPPDAADGPWTVRVKGEPARTDRPSRGFGNFIARGEWLSKAGTATVDVQLERSELGDMITLFNGYESGIEGTVSGDAHLAGPLSRLGLAGHLAVSNLHGWDQKPPGGAAWPLEVSGTMDAPSQSIDFYAKLPGDKSPLALRYRVSDYLKRPRWGVTVNVNAFSLEPLPAVLRNLGVALPAELRASGTAEGAFGWSLPEGTPRMDGALHVMNAQLITPGTQPLEIHEASVLLSGSSVRLAPAKVTNGPDDSATLAAVWDAGASTTEVELASDGMAIAPLHRNILAAKIPLLSFATAGRWKGKLRRTGDVHSGEPGKWSGDLHLEDTDIPFEAFAEPLHVASADAVLDGADLLVKKMSLAAGGMQAQGDYHYVPGAEHPHQFHLTAPKVDAAALEKLLMPTLRRGNLLTYAFNFGRAPQPDWLREMKADGVIQTPSFVLAGVEMTRVRSRVLWDGASVELSGLQWQRGTAGFSGTGAIQLANREPVYKMEGHLAGWPWRGGMVNAEGDLVTTGTGAQLLANLKVSGKFQARRIDLSAFDLARLEGASRGVWDAVTGGFEWAWAGSAPRMRFTDLALKNGTRTYEGSGETQSDGQVMLQVGDGVKKIQASGALLSGTAKN